MMMKITMLIKYQTTDLATKRVARSWPGQCRVQLRNEKDFQMVSSIQNIFFRTSGNVWLYPLYLQNRHLKTYEVQEVGTCRPFLRVCEKQILLRYCVFISKFQTEIQK